MSRVVAIGARQRLAGFALAGVEVRDAQTQTDARRELDAIEPDVGLVILTRDAAAALEGRPSQREDVIWVSLPR
jgi:vacuolar-type H+-ATPase subunit F/Vma7